jgi:D-alanyl-lipoteichoic acid acyltransferase DltB (MBOAT superfamily)
MLFNSYQFIFLFLPATLAGFFLLGRASRAWALAWVVLASLFFYAWWRPVNVLIIAPAVLINFVLARVLLQLGADHDRRRDAVLLLGIVFNVAFLGYFKYRNFIGTAINDLTGADIVLAQIILPLGISFITFQKIAFLIDVHGRRVDRFTLGEYCLFVLFFPQLIAGPIVHFREMMPQFRRVSCRPDAVELSVGLTLFCFGLFKKVVLADGMAPHVSPIYEMAAAGGEVSLLSAWVAATGFTLQIYFDFSGYTDMALGLGRCFGIRLPPNFDSPLKASSIIEFWSRWHMTLTRFLTAYLYNPLLLRLTRQRLARGEPGLTGHRTSWAAFLQLLAMPTLLTMFVSGLWHGAGYLFILWGLLHGVYLTINHAWRLFAPRLWPSRERYDDFMRPVGWIITFLAVVFSMVLFRSPTVGAALEVLHGMIGLNGVTLPQPLYERLGLLSSALQAVSSPSETMILRELAVAITWIAGLLVIALSFPNTLQLMARFEPAPYVRQRESARSRLLPAIVWRPSLSWGVAMSAIAVVAILRVAGKSEFLYWQF